MYCITDGFLIVLYEELENTKGTIKTRKSKDRQHNGVVFTYIERQDN